MKLHNSTLWAVLCLALLALLGLAGAASSGPEARASRLQSSSNGTGMEGGPGPTGANALELALSLTSGFDYTCGRSTDYGVTWATDIGCGTSVSTSYSDDREYIWVDHNPASPFYGRVYVTTALFDQAG